MGTIIAEKEAVGICYEQDKAPEVASGSSTSSSGGRFNFLSNFMGIKRH